MLKRSFTHVYNNEAVCFIPGEGIKVEKGAG